jgi:hypothetical protein
MTIAHAMEKAAGRNTINVVIMANLVITADLVIMGGSNA